MGNRIDLQFLLVAVLLLLCGIFLGLTMGIRQDFLLAPAHAHFNLAGWASLALFGLVYRAYPELAERKLAKVHFWLSAPAAAIFPVGIAISLLYQWPVLAILGSLVWIAGALVFLVQILSLFRTSEGRAAVPAE
jgi:hypothetical protein